MGGAGVLFQDEREFGPRCQNVPRQATTAAWAKYSVVSAASPQFKFQLQLQALQVLQQISSVRPSPALSLLVPHVRRAFDYLSNQMYVRNVETSVSDNTVHVHKK